MNPSPMWWYWITLVAAKPTAGNRFSGSILLQGCTTADALGKAADAIGSALPGDAVGEAERLPIAFVAPPGLADRVLTGTEAVAAGQTVHAQCARLGCGKRPLKEHELNEPRPTTNLH